MRKGCLVCGIITAFFGLVFLTLLPVLNWALYPKIERDVILKYLNLKPENEEIWDAWVQTVLSFAPGGSQEDEKCHKIGKYNSCPSCVL